MEIQKCIFRFASPSIKQPRAHLCWSIITYISFVFALLFTCLFIYGQILIKGNTTVLQNCLGQSQTSFEYDSLILVFDDSSQNMRKFSQQDNPLINSSYCSVFKNADYSKVTSQPEFTITNLELINSMEQKQQVELKIDNYTLIIKDYGWIQRNVYGMVLVVGNELIGLADNGKLGKVIGFDSFYFKSKFSMFHYSTQVQNSITFWSKLKGLLIIVVSYLTISIVNCLYIYLTIVCIPAIIIVLLKFTPCSGSDVFLELIGQFRWIGLHSLILRLSSKQHVRAEYTAICSSLIIYLIVMHMGYSLIVLNIADVFFDLPAGETIQLLFFGYFVILEIYSLLYMRTRPFLKFFPIISTFLILIFMLYCRFSHFGFKMIAILGIFCYSISLFGNMIIRLQIPASTTWNQNEKYVPSLKQCRAGLTPCFNLSWMNLMPDEWSMLIALVDRQHFDKKEMSFVDEDYEQFMNYLSL